MQLIEVVSPSNLLAQLHEPQQQSTPNGTHAVNPAPQPKLSIDVMRTSVIVCIVMLLKSHLKGLYGLSEE
ncbi:hypothetical protein J3R83DRAFT_10872 [Lanmaoa asiatica]|nr:hypothetical protein J3R83DRAFT_10872 [Lanmaoa asiatica]